MTTIEEQKEKNTSVSAHPKWHCLLKSVAFLKDAHIFKRCKCCSYGASSQGHFDVLVVGDNVNTLRRYINKDSRNRLKDSG